MNIGIINTLSIHQKSYKEFEGFAPIMAYIGTEGYLMKCELREGKANGQCAKTVPLQKNKQNF